MFRFRFMRTTAVVVNKQHDFFQCILIHAHIHIDVSQCLTRLVCVSSISQRLVNQRDGNADFTLFYKSVHVTNKTFFRLKIRFYF